MTVKHVTPNLDRYIDAICLYLRKRGVDTRQIDARQIEQVISEHFLDPAFPSLLDVADTVTTGEVIGYIDGKLLLSRVSDGKLFLASVEQCYLTSNGSKSE